MSFVSGELLDAAEFWGKWIHDEKKASRFTVEANQIVFRAGSFVYRLFAREHYLSGSVESETGKEERVVLRFIPRER